MKVNQHNASSFAELLGVQRSSLSHILNGRNNPSLDFITRLLDNFPNVDANWLVTGKEPKSEKRTDVHSASPKKQASGDKIGGISSNRKRIDKIVVFYSDHSFEEYEPAKD